MKDLARRAQVMIDFGKIPIQVSGVIRRPKGSVVLINGKARKEGDAVDQDGKLKLVEISDEALFFEFEGERIQFTPENRRK